MFVSGDNVTVSTEGHDEFSAGPAGVSVHAANQRHESHFRKADHHSFLVRFLKGALPVLAICLVAWFVFATFLNFEPLEEVNVESSGISNGKLIMDAPRVKGYNTSNLPYNLTAKRAVQDLKKPEIIALELIDAMLPAEDGSFAEVDAYSGIYDSSKELLNLEQDIVINRADGTTIKLDSAEIDLKSGSLLSRDPVNVSTPTTTISADEVEVIDNGAVIVFKNRVQMTVQPAAGTK